MGYSVEVELQADGMLHVAVPNGRPGERFFLTIEREEPIEIEEVAGKPVRVFGQFKDRIHILPGFNDPIEMG